MTLHFPNGELKYDPVHSFAAVPALCCLTWTQQVPEVSGPIAPHRMEADMSGTKSSSVRFSFITAAILCAGCAANTLSDNIASWQGSHIDEVKAAWGAPSECGVEGNQTVCTWTDWVAVKSDALVLETRPEMAGSALLPRPACIRTLAVDSSGYVTGWRWRGTRCPDSIVVARAE